VRHPSAPAGRRLARPPRAGLHGPARSTEYGRVAAGLFLPPAGRHAPFPALTRAHSRFVPVSSTGAPPPGRREGAGSAQMNLHRWSAVPLSVH
jgi:hypothetical protein